MSKTVKDAVKAALGEVVRAITQCVQAGEANTAKWKQTAAMVRDAYVTDEACATFLKSGECTAAIVAGLPKADQVALAFEKGTVPDEHKNTRKDAQSKVSVYRGRLAGYVTPKKGGGGDQATWIDLNVKALDLIVKRTQKQEGNFADFLSRVLNAKAVLLGTPEAKK